MDEAAIYQKVCWPEKTVSTAPHCRSAYAGCGWAGGAEGSPPAVLCLLCRLRQLNSKRSIGARTNSERKSLRTTRQRPIECSGNATSVFRTCTACDNATVATTPDAKPYDLFPLLGMVTQARVDTPRRDPRNAGSTLHTESGTWQKIKKINNKIKKRSNRKRRSVDLIPSFTQLLSCRPPVWVSRVRCRPSSSSRLYSPRLHEVYPGQLWLAGRKEEFAARERGTSRHKTGPFAPNSVVSSSDGFVDSHPPSHFPPVPSHGHV
ncbi:hypothetical protein B0I37DRAFT_212559 [Chaetomium sp. MPI-CAGE-AT-0009]|nr:hypothetical protein B0I37DRAFT_212559 [Chaetomium sp. MPI-CAGE-AT-0009]